MKKYIIFTGALLLASAMAGEAMAACPGTNQVTGVNLTNLLQNKTVCVAKSGGGWESQELHSGGASGNVIDYKMGPTDPVDKTEQVGTYAISEANSDIKYDYGSGGSYTYTVWGTGPYSFCNGSTETIATIQNVTNGCQ